jgi:hypothetical protein
VPRVTPAPSPVSQALNRSNPHRTGIRGEYRPRSSEAGARESRFSERIWMTTLVVPWTSREISMGTALMTSSLERVPGLWQLRRIADIPWRCRLRYLWTRYRISREDGCRSISNGRNGFRITAEFGGDKLGYSVSGAGDLNGDGYDDLLIGAIARQDMGRAYVVFGKGTGFCCRKLASGAQWSQWVQGDRGDCTVRGSGTSVSRAGRCQR